MDTKIVSTITSHDPGYLNKDLEKVVGVQTDVPFKRALQPFGGIRMAEVAAESYGFKVDEEISHIFLNTVKRITKVYLMLILLKCAQLVNQA